MDIEHGPGAAGWIGAILVSLAIWCAMIGGMALM